MPSPVNQEHIGIILAIVARRYAARGNSFASMLFTNQAVFLYGISHILDREIAELGAVSANTIAHLAHIDDQLNGLFGHGVMVVTRIDGERFRLVAQ